MRDKVASLPPAVPPRRLTRRWVVGLAAYYLICITGLIALQFVRRAVIAASGGAAPGPSSTPPNLPADTPIHLRDAMHLAMRAAPGWLDAGVEMASAFLLVVPVAFVYVRSRTRAKYDQSLAQTVLVLPTVVAAILIVVENSLALAFSLAGIVAAVRFRNNLKDSRDAVYIFAAVGIGFAAGVHDTGVAVMLSVGFCVLELLIWRVDLGAEHDSMFGRGWLLRVTAHHNGGAQVASAGAQAPAIPAEVEVRRRHDAGTPAPPAGSGIALPPGDFRLRVFAENLDGAQMTVEALLDRHVKRWTLARTSPGHAGGGVLEYRVRERKRYRIDEVRERLLSRGAPDVARVEVLSADGSQPPASPQLDHR